MPHLYEYITDAELYAYIRSVIERTHASFPTRAASLRSEDDAARDRAHTVHADRRGTATVQT
jgi:hypothetical protein